MEARKHFLGATLVAVFCLMAIVSVAMAVDDAYRPTIVPGRYQVDHGGGHINPALILQWRADGQRAVHVVMFDQGNGFVNGITVQRYGDDGIHVVPDRRIDWPNGVDLPAQGNQGAIQTYYLILYITEQDVLVGDAPRNNLAASPRCEFEVRYGWPEIEVRRDGNVCEQIAFGNVQQNQSATATLAIRNIGQQPLSVTSIGLTNESPAGQYTVDSNGNFVVNANASRNVVVTFRPTQVRNNMTATLCIQSNDHDEADRTKNISLSGNGTQPAQPNLSFDHAELNFANCQVGATATASITLSNTGNAAANGELSITGANANDFVLPDDHSYQLAAGGDETFTITFRPSAVGVKQATLQTSQEGGPTSNLSGYGRPRVNQTRNVGRLLVTATEWQELDNGRFRGTRTVTVTGVRGMDYQEDVLPCNLGDNANVIISYNDYSIIVENYQGPSFGSTSVQEFRNVQDVSFDAQQGDVAIIGDVRLAPGIWCESRDGVHINLSSGIFYGQVRRLPAFGRLRLINIPMQIGGEIQDGNVEYSANLNSPFTITMGNDALKVIFLDGHVGFVTNQDDFTFGLRSPSLVKVEAFDGRSSWSVAALHANVNIQYDWSDERLLIIEDGLSLSLIKVGIGEGRDQQIVNIGIYLKDGSYFDITDEGNAVEMSVIAGLSLSASGVNIELPRLAFSNVGQRTILMAGDDQDEAIFRIQEYLSIQDERLMFDRETCSYFSPQRTVLQPLNMNEYPEFSAELYVEHLEQELSSATIRGTTECHNFPVVGTYSFIQDGLRNNGGTVTVSDRDGNDGEIPVDIIINRNNPVYYGQTVVNCQIGNYCPPIPRGSNFQILPRGDGRDRSELQVRGNFGGQNHMTFFAPNDGNCVAGTDDFVTVDITAIYPEGTTVAVHSDAVMEMTIVATNGDRERQIIFRNGQLVWNNWPAASAFISRAGGERYLTVNIPSQDRFEVTFSSESDFDLYLAIANYDPGNCTFLRYEVAMGEEEEARLEIDGQGDYQVEVGENRIGPVEDEIGIVDLDLSQLAVYRQTAVWQEDGLAITCLTTLDGNQPTVSVVWGRQLGLMVNRDILEWVGDEDQGQWEILLENFPENGLYCLVAELDADSVVTEIRRVPPRDNQGEEGDQGIIPLEEGWNLISSYIIPNNPGITILLLGINDAVLIAKDYRGRFYNPRFNFNNMDQWDVGQGYQVKVDAGCILVIYGEAVPADRPIQLPQGWSMVAYFPEQEVAAPDAFANLGNNLIIAKDGLGRFYVPICDYSNMGDLQRGWGYQVKLSEAAELGTFQKAKSKATETTGYRLSTLPLINQPAPT